MVAVPGARPVRCWAELYAADRRLSRSQMIAAAATSIQGLPYMIRGADKV
jgi:hypothetical protein